ncbi:sensor histidine kinase [Penaeicola halotolerans]|uniref:sensor histidine kinase n=1 Tax=Penaeicola halotolerans TaxID=2793196 RepID=UPI001CF87B40|nr:histidine kinase [Penaeicola halotolerans]
MIQFIKKKVSKILLILLTFFGLLFIGFLNFPEVYNKHYFDQYPVNAVFDIITSLILCVLIIELFQWIDRRMNNVMPWHLQPIQRWIIQTIIQIFTTILLLFIYGFVTYLLMILFNIQVDDQAPKREDKVYAYYFLSVIFLSLIVSMVNTVVFLSSNWRREIITAAEYKTKAAESKQLVAQTELLALRLQLDSHFVFNNLSVLSELILKDQSLGYQYSENFARLYRYLLVNSKKELITLKEEMKFIESYLFLLKNRMGEGVDFLISVSEEQMSLKLPPISLQILIENAVKHNKVDKDSPLQVKIYSLSTDYLVVYNELKPLLKNPISSGIGLENIVKRYSLISDKTPIISQDNNSFIVQLPLLK